MSSVEYLFAAHIDLADAFAKAKGWRAYGRAQWQKRDGCVVYCLCLLVQLEIAMSFRAWRQPSRAKRSQRWRLQNCSRRQ